MNDLQIEQPPEERQESLAPGENRLSAGSPPVWNILIVDDKPANLKLLAELLVHHGYKVRPVLNGAQALASITALPPDIILLDIKMPDMSGYDVCSTLKQSAETRDIPVIFISAMDSVEDKIAAFQAGGVDYITKPFQTEEVLIRIENHLKIRRLQKSLQEKNDRLQQEITERKTTEQKLRESKHRLRQAHTIGCIGSWEYDVAADRVWGSIGTCQMLGIASAAASFPVEKIEKKIKEKGRFQSALSRLLEDNEPFSIEFRTQPDSGTPSRDMIAKAEQVQDEPGASMKVVGVFQDITERKKLESLLRQMHKMESIGTLAGGVAHDINNILGIILGNTELATDSISKQSAAYGNLEEVMSACFRAKEVIMQLLNFCRQNEQVRQSCLPEQMMKDVLKLIRSSTPEHIEIKLDIADNIKPVFIDPAQFHQVIINICSNAAHAMATQGKSLDIALSNLVLSEEFPVSTGLLMPGEYVRLKVGDTGVGMSPDVIERIFDPYFTTREIGKGAGMGLSIVHGIITSISGGISVKSTPGKGSRMTVFFPAFREE